MAFFQSGTNKLIYHRQDVFCHEIHSKKEIEGLRAKMASNTFKPTDFNNEPTFANWSSAGNVVYFIEYYKWNDVNVFDSVVLNLKEEYVLRIDELQNDFKIVNELGITESLFDETTVLRQLSELGIVKQAIHKDGFGLLSKFYGLFK